MDTKEKISKLQNEIKDLKDRMPAHSVKPEMVERLEELEEELDRLKRMD